MSTPEGRLFRIHLEDGTRLYPNNQLPAKYVHSRTPLRRSMFRWAGEVKAEDVTSNDVVATIDAPAYEARHQTEDTVIRLTNGRYPASNGTIRSLKLAAVIDGPELFIITVEASSYTEDIAPRAPLRISGLTDAHKVLRRFSSAQNSSSAA